MKKQYFLLDEEIGLLIVLFSQIKARNNHSQAKEWSMINFQTNWNDNMF